MSSLRALCCLPSVSKPKHDKNRNAPLTEQDIEKIVEHKDSQKGRRSWQRSSLLITNGIMWR